MLPWWKIRRELHRLGEQIFGIGELITGPLRRAQYDHRRSREVVVHDGRQPEATKVALLLLFQPSALARSVLVTCRHLRRRGYAVLAVANGGLQAGAVHEILPEVWRLAERPNFGYDFGGYREGIFLLKNWQIRPDHLLILNDSIWFPLSEAEDVLAQLEARESEISGMLLHIDTKYEGSSHRKSAGLAESYFLHVPGAIAASEGFSTYWHRLKITDLKGKTIQIGERGFSQAMQREGFSVTGISWRAEFLRRLARQSDEFLAKTLLYAAYTEPRLEQRGSDLCAAQLRDSAWRRDVLEHIRNTVRRRRFNGSFIWATELLFGLSFLKKLKQPLFSRMRQAYLAAVDNGDLPLPDPAILDEIRALQQEYRG